MADIEVARPTCIAYIDHKRYGHFKARCVYHPRWSGPDRGADFDAAVRDAREHEPTGNEG